MAHHVSKKTKDGNICLNRLSGSTLALYRSSKFKDQKR
jgi:hypothetical protein